MKVRVKLRFNKVTGEVEEFLVDDQDMPVLSEAEHNRKHDHIAAEIGNVIERHPRVTEVLPADRATPVHEEPSPASGETETAQDATQASRRHTH